MTQSCASNVQTFKSSNVPPARAMRLYSPPLNRQLHSRAPPTRAPRSVAVLAQARLAQAPSRSSTMGKLDWLVEALTSSPPRRLGESLLDDLFGDEARGGRAGGWRGGRAAGAGPRIGRRGLHISTAPGQAHPGPQRNECDVCCMLLYVVCLHAVCCMLCNAAFGIRAHAAYVLFLFSWLCQRQNVHNT